jgi:hypothetical protein
MEDTMTRSTLARRVACSLALAAFVTVPLITQPAAAQASDLFITAFADRYVANGQTFDDLDVLERAVGATRAGAVRIYACGSEAARAQMGAAHRFRDRYLELRVLDADAPQCRVTAAQAPRVVPVTSRSGTAPYGIDDALVARWWYEMMP